MKTVAFNLPPEKLRTASDAWVRDREMPCRSEPLKRFTIDVPIALHTRIKVACAARGSNMADVLRGLLEREFPVNGEIAGGRDKWRRERPGQKQTYPTET
jgi:hypothetical protein